MCTYSLVPGGPFEVFIAERLSAKHLILKQALGQYQCIYICLSRSSTHARWWDIADHGGAGDVFRAMDEEKRRIQSHG